MATRKSIYLHTINGHLAFFDGEQICYVAHGQTALREVLRPDLATIRREQRASVEYRRRELGCASDNGSDYDYLRLRD